MDFQFLKYLEDKKFLIPFFLFVSFLFLLAISYWSYVYFTTNKFFLQFNNNLSNKQPVYFSQLDGSLVTSKQDQIPEIVGIMIDNHPDARPQSGLSEASVVYEALVEGGMTRYLAIYNKEQVVEKVGPVRSARPYYIDFLGEYGHPVYMFCGGSPQALEDVKSVNLLAGNEIYFGSYYWRDNALVSPHNLFTSSSLWKKLSSNFNKNSTSSVWSGWQFSNSVTSSKDIKDIILSFSYYYEVEWKYNENKNNYERYIDNVQQKDSAGMVLTADNILIQFAPVQLLDEVGRLQIDTSGGGEARVLRKGGMIYGAWKKENSRTRFYDKEGQEIFLVPGKTWVEVLPANAIIKVSN